jgi:hypothetical protein
MVACDLIATMCSYYGICESFSYDVRDFFLVIHGIAEALVSIFCHEFVFDYCHMAILNPFPKKIQFLHLIFISFLSVAS